MEINLRRTKPYRLTAAVVLLLLACMAPQVRGIDLQSHAQSKQIRHSESLQTQLHDFLSPAESNSGGASDETQVFLEGDVTKQAQSEKDPLKETQELISFLTEEKKKTHLVKENAVEVAKFKRRQQQKFEQRELAQVAEKESESAGSGFFYVDDFFYWLSCKFVTCDKRKESHSHKADVDHKQDHKQDRKQDRGQGHAQEHKVEAPPAHKKDQPAPHASAAAKKAVQDEDADTEDDKREMEEAEKSMKAKTLSEVSKISKQYDHSRGNHSTETRKQYAQQRKAPVASTNAKQAHSQRQEPPKNQSLSQSKAGEHRKQAPAHNATQHKMVPAAENKTVQAEKRTVNKNQTKQVAASVKKNSTALAAPVVKLANKTAAVQQNATTSVPSNAAVQALNSTVQQQPQPLASQQPEEPQQPSQPQIQKKNPFGDFSQFEESIDSMQPLAPDQQAQSLVSKIKSQLNGTTSTPSSRASQAKHSPQPSPAPAAPQHPKKEDAYVEITSKPQPKSNLSSGSFNKAAVPQVVPTSPSAVSQVAAAVPQGVGHVVAPPQPAPTPEASAIQATQNLQKQMPSIQQQMNLASSIQPIADQSVNQAMQTMMSPAFNQQMQQAFSMPFMPTQGGPSFGQVVPDMKGVDSLPQQNLNSGKESSFSLSNISPRMNLQEPMAFPDMNSFVPTLGSPPMFSGQQQMPQLQFGAFPTGLSQQESKLGTGTK